MGHTPKTEIGRLARAYREHEHEPDYESIFNCGDETELEDEVPSEKTCIARHMQDLFSSARCLKPYRGKPWLASNRHGRSRKVHIPLQEGEIATDSHGRLLYVLGQGGRRVTQGYARVKMSEVAVWNPRATGTFTGVTA